MSVIIPCLTVFLRKICKKNANRNRAIAVLRFAQFLSLRKAAENIRTHGIKRNGFVCYFFSVFKGAFFRLFQMLRIICKRVRYYNLVIIEQGLPNKCIYYLFSLFYRALVLVYEFIMQCRLNRSAIDFDAKILVIKK